MKVKCTDIDSNEGALEKIDSERGIIFTITKKKSPLIGHLLGHNNVVLLTTIGGRREQK